MNQNGEKKGLRCSRRHFIFLLHTQIITLCKQVILKAGVSRIFKNWVVKDVPAEDQSTSVIILKIKSFSFSFFFCGKSILLDLDGFLILDRQK